MKQLPLTQVGEPQFRQSCSAVSEQDILNRTMRTLIERMKYTMARVHGVGLAGPQVGVQQQLFVMRQQPTKYRPTIRRIRPYAVFNPVVLHSSQDEQTDWEGCFSVAHAGLFAKVRRPHSIHVRYLNEAAQVVEREITGLEARIFLHEYDHLIGRTFFDGKVELDSLMDVAAYRSMRERSVQH